MHIKDLIIRGFKGDVLLFSKHVHKNIRAWQMYMSHLAFTLQYLLKTLYINYFYTSESKVRVKSLVPIQPHGDNFHKKDFVFNQFGELNTPVSLHAFENG